MELSRGMIVLADLGRHINDSIQGGVRPVVVVSNNRCNRHSSVITVVPLSSRIYSKKNMPTHVFVNANENEGLDRHSIALCEQVTILPVNKIIDVRYGRLNDDVMDEITEAVQIQIGVFEEYNM